MSNLIDFEIDLDECVEMANDAMRVAMEDMEKSLRRYNLSKHRQDTSNATSFGYNSEKRSRGLGNKTFRN